MDCAAYRRTLLAEPLADSEALRQHRETCAECAAFTARLQRFEGVLLQALKVDVDLRAPHSGVVVPLRPRRAGGVQPPRRWLAAAASVLLAVAVAGGLWLAAPGPSLAAAVVAHMAGEPDAWVRTAVPVPEPRLASVLGASGVRLKGSAGLVSYANSCLFRGHQVPHLVVQTASGPVTVMVLTHEAVAHPTTFDESGYRGVIVPLPGHGSLAVLERGSGSDLAAVDSVAARVRDAIDGSRPAGT